MQEIRMSELHFEQIPLKVAKQRAREYTTAHRRELRDEALNTAKRKMRAGWPKRLNDGIQYPWQQSVLDALAAPPELLPRKIAKAERAIAAELREYDPDKTEGRVLKNALGALGGLIAETKEPRFHVGEAKPSASANGSAVATSIRKKPRRSSVSRSSTSWPTIRAGS
jgi:hypothetical protein